MGILLSLQDGDLIDFKENSDASGGCETCDWGSSYVQDFSVVTTQGTWEFSFDQMYEYAVSHEFMFKTILPNVETIKALTIEGFIEWLKARFSEQAEESYGSDLSFTVTKVK